MRVSELVIKYCIRTSQNICMNCWVEVEGHQVFVSQDSIAISIFGPDSRSRSADDCLFRFFGLFEGFILALGHSPLVLNVHESHFGPTATQIVCLTKKDHYENPHGYGAKHT